MTRGRGHWRLLVAVLTALGTVPLRVCTCGAAHVHTPAHTATDDSAPTPDFPGVTADTDEGLGHHHDCGMLKPRAALSLAVPVDVADAPPDDAVAPALVSVAAATIPRPPPAPSPRPPDPSGRPLFQTLCSLRI